MRKSKTRARIAAGQAVRMCSLGHYIPAYIRLASAAGFDCIWLDAEHRCFTDRELQGLLAQFHLHDIDCMLRPATLEKSRLYRYLEDGATGLMIPHVSTPEKAQMLADFVKFPPLGDRGLDGAGLDCDYTFQGGADYPAEANAQTFLVVQIETPEAVENVDAIAAVPGVDGLFVGPGDLGLRLRQTGEEAALEAAIEQVAAAAAKHGKAWGIPAVGGAEALKRRREQGAQLVPHGGEFGALMQMLNACAADFDALD